MNHMPGPIRSAHWLQLLLFEQAEEERRKGEDVVGIAAPTSLWPALWSAYGWPYVSLGLLKLLGDALNFAGSQATSPCSDRSL
jgi:hypothetical protein